MKMEKAKKWAKINGWSLKRVVLRFPVAAVALFALAILCTLASKGDFLNENSPYTVWIYASAYGALSGIAAVFLSERIQKGKALSLGLQALALSLGAAFAFLPAKTQQEFALLRFLIACAGLYALILFIPTARDGADFGWVVVAHIKAVSTALLIGVVLYIGCALVLSAVDYLLVSLDGHVFVYAAIWIFAFIVPLYVLSLMPHFGKSRDPISSPRFFELMSTLILIPLMAAATAVFFLYMVKCAVTLTWPVGEVGPMVLSYSAFGMAVYLFSLPVAKKIALQYRLLFPYGLALFVLLQLYSIFVRVQAYGVTEPRYYLALGALFSLASGLYLLLRRGRKPGVLALLAFCFIAFSLLPLVGARSVSGMSQRARVEQLLEKHGMLKEDKLIPGTDVPFEDRRDITSRMDYLLKSGQAGTFAWLPAELEADTLNEQKFQEMFGFEKTYGMQYTPEYSPFIDVRLKEGQGVDISGFDSMMEIGVGKYEIGASLEMDIRDGAYTLTQKTGEKGQPILTLAETAATQTLALDTLPLLDQWAQAAYGETLFLLQENMTVSSSVQGLEARLVFSEIQAGKKADGRYEVLSGRAYLFLKSE